jgi:HK97 family phage portal protein
MSWLTNITARLRGVMRQQWVRYGRPSLFGFLPAELRLSREQMISVSAAYGALRAVVDPIAASDWEVFVQEGTTRKNLRAGEAFYFLNVRANRNLPAIAAKELLLTAAVLHGDGYALILRDNAGRVVGWDPLDSERMAKSWRTDESAIGGGRIVYEYTQEDGSVVEIPDTDIIHLRGPSVANLFGGDSILARATIAVATAAAQEKFGNVYFANGAHLGGYIQLKGRLKTQGDVDRLKADWNRKNAGIDKAGETAVLEDGAEFKDLTPDPERVQLVAPRAFQVEEIARYFGVPLVKLMVKEAATGYGANLSTLNEQFSRDTLTPWSKRTAQECGFKMLPQRAPWAEIEVNLKWTTRGDAESRARVRKSDVEAGVVTRDEARAEEGLSALPDGVGSVPTVLGDHRPLAQLRDQKKPEIFQYHLAAGIPTVNEVRERLALPPVEGGDAPTSVAPPAQEQPPDPAPQREREEKPEDDEGEDEDVENIVRAAVVLALGNHARRWRARVRDIPEEKVPAAREELRGRLAAELAPFDRYLSDSQFAALATAVEAGFDPVKLATHILIQETA